MFFIWKGGERISFTFADFTEFLLIGTHISLTIHIGCDAVDTVVIHLIVALIKTINVLQTENLSFKGTPHVKIN